MIARYIHFHSIIIITVIIIIHAMDNQRETRPLIKHHYYSCKSKVKPRRHWLNWIIAATL